MKGKAFRIALASVLVLLVLCVGVMACNHLSFRVGRCIKAANGSCMLLMDHSPVVLSNHTMSTHPFSDYCTGDLLLVLHDGIQETYPGGTGAYLTLRLQKGTAGDISQTVVNALAELGWVIE